MAATDEMRRASKCFSPNPTRDCKRTASLQDDEREAASSKTNSKHLPQDKEIKDGETNDKRSSLQLYGKKEAPLIRLIESEKFVGSLTCRDFLFLLFSSLSVHCVKERFTRLSLSLYRSLAVS